MMAKKRAVKRKRHRKKSRSPGHGNKSSKVKKLIQLAKSRKGKKKTSRGAKKTSRTKKR